MSEADEQPGIDLERLAKQVADDSVSGAQVVPAVLTADRAELARFGGPAV